MIRTPEKLIKDGYKIFIDTNIFMHTEQREDNNLKNMVARAYGDILAQKNPIIITSKVLEELNRHSSASTGTFASQGKDASAIDRAQNAVKFITAAEGSGLFRTDLGDTTNPYADDTFVAVFKAYENTYDMCLITNDITLLLLIRELNYRASKTLLAGTITSNGDISIESDRELLTRGRRKLEKLNEKLISTGGHNEKVKSEKATVERALSSLSKLSGISLSEMATRPYSANGSKTAPSNDNITETTNSKPAFEISTKIASPDAIIQTTSIPSEGDIVTAYDSNETPTDVMLGTLLGAGGEGSAYSVGNDWVIKIYDREHLTEHREKKIRLLVKRNLSFEGICFPTGVVLNNSGQFVGYIMPKAEGKEFSKELFSPRRFRKAFPDWKKSDLIDICIAALEQIAFLHNNGIILGDINPKNLLVTKDKRVYIIDADSWQIEGYPCPVGTPMFTAPEIQGKHYPDFLRTLSNENYAVVTLLFQIMITGQFPYARMGFDGDIAKSIKSGLFAFQWKGNSNKDQPKGNWKYMWSHLNPHIKEMFWNTFHKNGTTHAQTKRPSVEQWLAAFKDYRNDIRNGFDPMSNDVYPIRFRKFRSDTPVYKCAKCGNEICGIWQDDKQEYYRPLLCSDCKDTQSRCSECGKPTGKSDETLCYDCRRKRDFAPCSVCGSSTHKSRLIAGKCPKCQTVACKRCGTQTPKSYLKYGTCSVCHSKENTLDISRKCSVCGKPFLTYGHIWWHQDKYKPIPTSHKRGDQNCRPAIAQAAPQARSQPSVPTQQSNSSGCYIATYIYSTYDCPELWVLRRYRDETLKSSAVGRLFIKAYYYLSPRLISKFGKCTVFNKMASIIVNRIVAALNHQCVSNERYFGD
jgi:serine/threonine protein kinase/rRNA-processing protein FCF1